jgi:hypothetical protein
MYARCTLILALASAGTIAQFPQTESAKFTADFYLKSFGRSVATDGARIVVGSPFESLDRGRVYVYQRIGERWMLEDSFQPDVPVITDNFGAAVDIDGDVIAVGAPSGFTFALQAWITDAAGPVGFSATNGVLGSVP